MLRRSRCVIAENPLLGREPAPAEPEKRESWKLLLDNLKA